METMHSRILFVGISACIVALLLAGCCGSAPRSGPASDDSASRRLRAEAAAEQIFGSAVREVSFDDRRNRPHIAVTLDRPVEPRAVFQMLSWLEREGGLTNSGVVQTVWPFPDGTGDLRRYEWSLPDDSDSADNLTFSQGRKVGSSIPLAPISTMSSASPDAVAAIADGKVSVPEGFVRSSPPPDLTTMTPGAR